MSEAEPVTDAPAIIDSHQHVWDLQRVDYPWLTAEFAPVNRSMGMPEIRPEFAAAGVDATILVQSADSDEDTEYMLEIAQSSPEVVGVVGWVPLNTPTRVESRLEELSDGPYLVGVRALIHEYADPYWLLRPSVDAGLAVLEASDTTFDLVTSSPAALTLVPIVSDRHPTLRIVIDHLAKPPMEGPESDLAEWSSLLAAAAENPLVYAKISGLYAPKGRGEGSTHNRLQAIIERAVNLFGTERVMYGGDWPISVLAGGYAQHWAALSSIFDAFDAVERGHVLSGTASRVYALDAELMRRAVDSAFHNSMFMLRTNEGNK